MGMSRDEARRRRSWQISRRGWGPNRPQPAQMASSPRAAPSHVWSVGIEYYVVSRFRLRPVPEVLVRKVVFVWTLISYPGPSPTDANKWFELQDTIRRQIKDVRKRSKELEERRGKHQRELETVITATINHHRPRSAHLLLPNLPRSSNDDRSAPRARDSHHVVVCTRP